MSFHPYAPPPLNVACCRTHRAVCWGAMAAVALPILLWCTSAQAQFQLVAESCTSDEQVTQPAAVSIGRDLGTTPATRIIGPAYDSAWYQINCYRFGEADALPLDFELRIEMLQNAVGTVEQDGLTYSVYPIGDSGLGFIMAYRVWDGPPGAPGYTLSGGMPTQWTPVTHNGLPANANVKVTVTRSGSSDFTALRLLNYRFQLVWLGPLPVPATLPPLIESFVLNLHVRTERKFNMTTSWDDQPVMTRPRLSATFLTTSGTCTTPSVPTVLLPQVKIAQFNGPGTTASGAVQDFNLTFTNCPPNMHSIHYKMYSTHLEDNTLDNVGLLSLNGSPSAAGVKVQLLRRSQNQTDYVPVRLEQWEIFRFNSAGLLEGTPPPIPPLDSITIPFRAQYYQTDSVITPGPVKATVLFQILYQ